MVQQDKGKSKKPRAATAPQKPATTAASDAAAKGSKKHKGLGQQLRDIRRLLARPNLPATVRQAHERQLAALELERQTSTSDKAVVTLERTAVNKYHAIRFFERRKLLRLMETARKKDQPDLSQLAKWMADVNYVTYFPKSAKYLSLFPKTEPDARAKQAREAIHRLINRFVTEGALKQADGYEPSKALGETDEQTLRALEEVAKQHRLLSDRLVSAREQAANAQNAARAASAEDDDAEDDSDDQEEGEDEEEDASDSESEEDKAPQKRSGRKPENIKPSSGATSTAASRSAKRPNVSKPAAKSKPEPEQDDFFL
ncbi:hypothetical protein CAOG_01297 [Capsaspora owczarzaki ATCC 30864]|uniref:rRNA-processing protein EFG1 n=1 Tax=Capsaspora owczarzaki (strain ATCC 30864) TaxID=595528 RepID=A0A0D2WK24_CAPO3|nr:hypothetical protein CAOG_01297 [Capsaspora owczarzaki ATCC 30864]KJE89888.1 hypothetical protein CAOG_001297 [Capsaspora owczarzaki ATCC 30864]|eukprot:XP_004349817.1 hypothetical protein CAOG_01297 [Capsaspora owczarzaki ATCC 30864]